MTQTIYRVAFQRWDERWEGGGLPMSFHSKPTALAGIASGMATGRYAKAVLTKLRLSHCKWSRETVLSKETFEATQRVA